MVVGFWYRYCCGVDVKVHFFWSIGWFKMALTSICIFFFLFLVIVMAISSSDLKSYYVWPMIYECRKTILFQWMILVGKKKIIEFCFCFWIKFRNIFVYRTQYYYKADFFFEFILNQTFYYWITWLIFLFEKMFSLLTGTNERTNNNNRLHNRYIECYVTDIFFCWILLHKKSIFVF